MVSFLKELELICLHTSIAIVSTQINGFNELLTLIILFKISHLFADSEMFTSTAIQHYSFVCTQLNDSKCYVM